MNNSFAGNGKNLVVALCCCVSVVQMLSGVAYAYDSSSYVQNGLIAQWDGIDNQGTGTHDPTATTWKDLKGSLDMALTDKGSWTADGNALYVAGGGAGAQGASATPAYKTIEIVYKMTEAGGRILFNSGINTRFVVFDGDGTRLYFDGSTDTSRINCLYDADTVRFAASTYDGSTVSNIYFNGEVQNVVDHKNTWGTGDGKVAVGDRTLSKAYPWTGEVYAIRLYDRVLTDEEIASNCAIDKARFLPPPPPEDEEVILTSSSYVQDGLVGQYDGIDNQGTGTHDPAATTWKDLVGNNDLTLTNTAAWCRGIGLSMDQTSAGSAAAYGKTVAPSYQTIEIFFRETSRSSRIMLWSGDTARYVIFDYGNVTYPFVWAYFDGRKEVIKGSPTPYVKMQAYVPTSLAATYGRGENDEVADVYCDGVQRYGGGSVNDWSAGVNCLTLGGKYLSGSANYGWSGEIYAIRFYNRVLTPEEIARNHAIDVKRFYTSALYQNDGLTAFWDAQDNAGVGQHSDTTTIWKNLVAGGQDLTLNNSAWNGDSLACDNSTKSGAYGTEPMTFSSMEIAFRNEKNSANGWLFSGGVAGYYCVLGTDRAQWCNYEGLYKTFSFSYCGFHSLATTRDGATTNAFVDGVSKTYEKTQSPKRPNELDDWGPGGEVVQVGSRANGSMNFLGRIYSVRLYDNVPSKERIWANSEIDRVRYGSPLTWHGPSSEIGDGDFETYGNWVNIDQTFKTPNENNTVNLPCGTYKIQMSRNHKVAAMQARNGNVEACGRYIDATLDMGGKTFTLLGDYQADAVRGVGGNRYASLTLTNGTFKAEGVLIGALSERVPSVSPYYDYAKAFVRGSGSLIVEGPDTTASIARVVQLEGPFTRLRVAGGATFTCGGICAYATQSGDDRAQFDFTGSGTTATVGSNGLYVHRDVDMTVSDGASLTFTGYYESFSQLGGPANVFGRNCDTTPGNSSRFVVDNATVTMSGYPFVVGADRYQNRGVVGSSFTLQNNAKLVLTGSGMTRFVVGAGANNANSFAENNVLNVLDGSVFGYGEGGASARLEIGICGNTSFSGVNVSNATVNCVRLIAGSKIAPAASSNNFVHVMGETAKINVSGTGADSIYLRMGARLKFTIPENGFAETPIATAGGVKVERDEDFAAEYGFQVDPVKLVIDASKFEGVSQTLISCASNSTEYLQRLVNNKAGKGKILIEEDGTKLVWVRSGTMLVIR